MNQINTKRYRPQEVCQLLDLSYRQLEYWVLIGVVEPIFEPHGKKRFQRFNDEDLRFLKAVKTLTDEGYLVSRAAEKIRRFTKSEGRLKSPTDSWDQPS